MRDRLPPPPPIIVDKPTPAVDSGTTEYFTDPTAKSLARLSFERPRPMVAYAFWDPYKNNPGPEAFRSTRTDPPLGSQEIQALGRIRIGSQKTLIEFNFDLPWGQLIAIPVTAEQVEVTARLVSPIDFTTNLTPDFQTANDPPALIIAPGHTLPNPSTSQFPTGFVALSGEIGVGSAGPASAEPPTRSFLIQSVAPGLANVVTVPLAYGARRVTVLGDPVATTIILQRFPTGANAVPIFANQERVPLGNNCIGITLNNTGAVPTSSYLVIYELGI